MTEPHTDDEQSVRAAIQVFLVTTAAPDGDPTTVSQLLRDRLVPTGISDALCEELATFVPLAFTREVLRFSDCKIDYPSYYVAASISSATETQYPLSRNGLYSTACSIASEWIVDEEKTKIASFSGEYRALTNLIEDGRARGAELEQAAVSPPYVVYSKFPPGLCKEDGKPWWKLW